MYGIDNGFGGASVGDGVGEGARVGNGTIVDVGTGVTAGPSGAAEIMVPHAPKIRLNSITATCTEYLMSISFRGIYTSIESWLTRHKSDFAYNRLEKR